jgi:hypothetical protein
MSAHSHTHIPLHRVATALPFMDYLRHALVRFSKFASTEIS